MLSTSGVSADSIVHTTHLCARNRPPPVSIGSIHAGYDAGRRHPSVHRCAGNIYCPSSRPHACFGVSEVVQPFSPLSFFTPSLPLPSGTCRPSSRYVYICRAIARYVRPMLISTVLDRRLAALQLCHSLASGGWLSRSGDERPLQDLRSVMLPSMRSRVESGGREYARSRRQLRIHCRVLYMRAGMWCDLRPPPSSRGGGDDPHIVEMWGRGIAMSAPLPEAGTAAALLGCINI
jgi:hypothetical protein